LVQHLDIDKHSGYGNFSPFDHAPFPLLDTVVAIEAIFLGSFIVMRQSRLSRRPDGGDHLILQVLMLAEKEMTAVLNPQTQLAVKADLPELPNKTEIAQLSPSISIDEVTRIRVPVGRDVLYRHHSVAPVWAVLIRCSGPRLVVSF
jgi:uncharacterized membrane protein